MPDRFQKWVVEWGVEHTVVAYLAGMTDLPKAYDPAIVEQKWYRFWLEQRYFHGDRDYQDTMLAVHFTPEDNRVI